MVFFVCLAPASLVVLISFAAFTVDALPAGYHYAGPTTSQATDLCQCNTVAYSLLSACDACQGADFVSYGTPRFPLQIPGLMSDKQLFGIHWELLKGSGPREVSFLLPQRIHSV